MQQMDPPASRARELQHTIGGAHRRFHIAPDRMRRHIPALLGDMHALAQPLFVLGMDRHAAKPAAQHGLQRLVIGHQQAAGRAPHEDLDPGAAGAALGLSQFGGVFRRSTNEEGDVAARSPLGACDFVGDVAGGQRVGVGVGHLEDCRHAAQHRCGGACR
jgi:hypothetical protein